MAVHAQMSASSEETQANIKNTLFMVNLDSSGYVLWSKQYYNDLVTSNADNFPYYIQTCRISSDSSYIAMTTIPYNIITLNLTSGDVLKSYKHNKRTYPTFFNLQNFLFPTAGAIYTGYTDDYQWQIVKIPFTYVNLTEIKITRSNN